ncbi:MAG: hypothetical protein AAF206_07175 [Bacteroidota bacterium]
MKYLCYLLLIFGLLSCQRSEALHPKKLRKQLLGRWEATQMSTNGQTVHFGEASSMGECASAIVPFEYNSGFELRQNGDYELFWCLSPQTYLVSGWYEEENRLHFPWIDEREAIFEIQSVAEEEIVIVSEEGQIYYMQRLN